MDCVPCEVSSINNSSIISFVVTACEHVPHGSMSPTPSVMVILQCEYLHWFLPTVPINKGGDDMENVYVYMHKFFICVCMCVFVGYNNIICIVFYMEHFATMLLGNVSTDISGIYSLIGHRKHFTKYHCTKTWFNHIFTIHKILLSLLNCYIQHRGGWNSLHFDHVYVKTFDASSFQTSNREKL